MDFVLQKKDWKDLTPGQRMYGENEPPEKQITEQWVIVECCDGIRFEEPRPDFSEFSSADRMYPSMMKPEIKARWEECNREWEKAKENYQRIKRLCHARFIMENPDLKLAQDLAGTAYGREVLEEFSRSVARSAQQSGNLYLSPHPAGNAQAGRISNEGIHSGHQSRGLDVCPYVNHNLQQAGSGPRLHDKFASGDVRLGSAENIRVTPFCLPNDAGPFSAIATARNADGCIVEKLLALDPKDHHVQYEYDAGGRLARVWKDERVIEHYQYGKAGERLTSETFNSGIRRFTYGEGLRLVRAGDVKYSYDPQGRLTMKQERGQVTRYEYDSNSQMTQVLLPDGRRISYIVDPDGVRTGRQVNGRTVETYSWKDRTSLHSVADAQGRVMEFTYDANGDPLTMSWNGENYHFASDQVGTIYMVVNGKGNELKRVIGDSFGNIIVDSNKRFHIPLAFAAGLCDPDTGLIHFGFREYDPSTGRFTCPDSLGQAGGGADLYGYCANDPVNSVGLVWGKDISGQEYLFQNGRNMCRAIEKEKLD